MGARIVEIGSRRSFLAGLSGLFVALAGFGRRLVAQVSRAVRYRPLARPTVILTADLATPWRSRPFVAEAVTLPTAATPNQPIRVAGMIVRVEEGQFAAVCMRCPHELCDVDYVDDPKRLPQEIVNEIGRPVTQPVYVCPCHNSTFRVEDGERLAGPAPRGLYRFRVTNLTETTVEIAEVEEDVLVFV